MKNVTQEKSKVYLAEASHVSFIKWDFEHLFLFFVLLAGVCIRLYRLDAQSLWIDEAFQYQSANKGSIFDVINEILRSGKLSHPPLSYIINYVFLKINNSDFFLRLPSVFFGIASLPLYYVFAKRILPTYAALFGLAVFALSPFHLWYSQEARMYSQLLFLSLLSAIVFFRAVDSQRCYWWWGLYALSIAVGMYTHIFMVFVGLTHALWLLFSYRQHVFAFCASVVVAGLLFFPYVNVLLQHYHNFGERSFEVSGSPVTLLYTFFVYSVGFSFGPSVAELHENRSIEFLMQFMPVIFTVGLVFGSLLIYGAIKLYERSPKNLLICAVGLGVPILGTYLYSLAPNFKYNIRYTIMAFPFFCSFLGMGLFFLYHKNKKIFLTILISSLVFLSFSIHNYFYNNRYEKEDIRSAISFWRDVAKFHYILTNDSVTVDRYLQDEEKKYHLAILGGDRIVSNINDFFGDFGSETAFILLSRDWNKEKKELIKNRFVVKSEKSFANVEIFIISRN